MTSRCFIGLHDLCNKIVVRPKTLLQCCRYYSGVNFSNNRPQRRENQGDNNCRYDVIVVGGGHAGCEASHAAARMGARTLLITHNKATIGAMSCNPSFGGIGKGHLLRELDALDGLSPRICDKAGIHYKVLNRTKGPAVWGPRAQIDRGLYRHHLQEELLAMPRLTVREAAVEDLLVTENQLTGKRVEGVVLADGEVIQCGGVIITAGTFLRGKIHLGLDVRPAGRVGDAPAVGLAKTLDRLNFKLARLKTGTPPRLVKSTIDWRPCTVWEPDVPPMPFSFMNTAVDIKPSDQVPCHITWTPVAIEEVIRESWHLNHHLKEEVLGPRYCPSIESKMIRFPGRQHRVWLEPEGLESDLVYPQGLNCTMPVEYQLKMLRLVPGLEKVEIAQPGYGVEYDYLEPRDLHRTLESRLVSRLFLAGQVNGTTGYEEAAVQGLIAGVNAACSPGRELRIDRTEGYIGVLLDDLTTQGVTEPYRMFTARAEYRLSLRPDNADLRLTQKGHEAGCVSDTRYERLQAVRRRLESAEEQLRGDVRHTSQWSKLLDLPFLTKRDNKSAFEVLGIANWGVDVARLAGADPAYRQMSEDEDLCFRLGVEALYHLSVLQQNHEIGEVRREEALTIPKNMDYYSSDISLSNEMRDKLNRARPESIAAAGRVPGISPSAVVNLMRYAHHVAKRSNTSESGSVR